MKEIIINIIFLIVGIFILFSRNRHLNIIKDLKNTNFVLVLILLILFSYWGLVIEKNDRRIYHSTRHALVAFMIAYMAHADLVFAAFIGVWLLTYYIPQL